MEPKNSTQFSFSSGLLLGWSVFGALLMMAAVAIILALLF